MDLTRKRRTLGFRLLLLCGLGVLSVLSSSMVTAQSFGRLVLVVKNADGEVLPGATVTATTEALTKFHQEKTTDKKGKVTLTFGDATKTYALKVELEGYLPFEMPFDPVARDSVTREVQLTAKGASPGQERQSTAEGTVVYSAAERTLNEGVEALRSGDDDTALSRFLAALDKDPDMALAHSALGGLYVERGEFEAAIASAKRFLEIEPGNPRAYRILYEAHSGLGRKDEAEKALSELAALDDSGDAARMVYNEGVAALDVGDTKTAVERFRQAIEIEPGLTPALSALATSLMDLERFEEAAKAAEDLLQIEPDNLSAKGLAYDAYKAAGDRDNEKMAFDRLAAADPVVVGKALYERGVTLFNEGNVADAEAQFERALEADPSLNRAHYYLGLCLANRGAGGSAREHLLRFVELAPEDPDAAIAAEMAKSLSGGG